MDCARCFCYNTTMKVKIIDREQESILNADKGENLLSLLQRQGFFIEADCGGNGACGKCKVKLIEGYTNAPLLDGYFNACRHTIDDDITISLNTVSGAFSSINQTSYTTKKQSGFGLAVDIGTTSLAVYLIDLSEAKVLEATAELNRQISFGADVLSRISAAKDGKSELMKKSIRNQIAAISERLCKKHEIQEIKKTVITGNTTMLHLYAGADPSGMGQAPFQPVFVDTQYEENTVLLPSASAFIGSDALAGAMSSGMLDREDCMLIDIGTNGEIILKYKEKYFACAAAAGPAFEGGNIEKGMGGVEGAIDHVFYNYGKLTYSTVSGTAKGICGSGITDLIAIFIEQGIIDKTGALNENDCVLSNNISDGKFFITKEVYITQKDIREFQLAKSALRSAIDVLLKKAGCDKAAVSAVFLAGGFGYYLNSDSAIKVGLLPQEFAKKIVSVGNAGGKGAIMCLVDEDNIEVCQKIANNITVIDLNAQAEFFQDFVDNMNF